MTNPQKIFKQFREELDLLFKDVIKKTARAYVDYEKTTNKIMERWKK